MSLDGAIDGLRTTLSAMSGLSRTYDDPPESINQFPSLIVYSDSGTMEYNASGGQSLHLLVAEVYHARQHMPQAIDAAKVWPDRAYALLKDDYSLGGAVSHIVWPYRYRIRPKNYNDIVHLVCRFEITVKVNET